jgi:probable rRNA maturation factor
MRELNRTYRRRNETTDVLSFPAGPVPAGCGERHLGDIVISVETARRQATRARHSLGTELKILALHGYLHLLGHDHEADDGAMLRLQRALTRRLVGPGRGRTAS